MWRHRLALPCVTIFLWVTAVVACGPDFPWQLLDNRAATLEETPANSFAFEAEHLESSAADGLKVLEQAPSTDSEEATELSAKQLAVIRTMRSSVSGDAAFAKGAILPAGIRLYTAGAVDFNRGQLGPARARFQAILLLPDVKKGARATWAAYMLGRIYVAEGDTENALQAFKLTRELAVEGAPDPLDLAVSSYGEEARVYLRRAKGYLDGGEIPGQAMPQYSRDVSNAVALYSQQAADEPGSGVWSLRFIAHDLLSNDTKIRATVSNPLVQRVLVAYALAKFKDAPAWRISLYPLNQPPRPIMPEPYHLPTPDPVLFRLVDAIEANGIDHPAGADRLAALAYRVGRYDLARKLAAQATGPLAAWVRAKLSLQKGDLRAAAAFYAEASKAFPPAGPRSSVLDERNETLLPGENGVLTLARGEYVDALAQLYPMATTYWGDVAYIAERVLTVDELKQFVDVRVPTPGPSKPVQYQGYGWLWHTDPALRLRDLLARRLVREGRYNEAILYFGQQSAVPDFHRWTDPNYRGLDVRKPVAEYAQALNEASGGWWRVNRARAWYQAALLARNSGMEMMGYEGPPDYFATDGAYDGGLGQLELAREFVSRGERASFVTSAAEPDYRFHYRYIAVQEASRAADLLPPRSQAFAAVLCHATGWMLATQSVVYRSSADGRDASRELVHQLYHRYVKQGPYVPWAVHFGHGCPDPDFASATVFNRAQFLKRTGHLADHHKWPILAFVLMGVLGLAVVWGTTTVGPRA